MPERTVGVGIVGYGFAGRGFHAYLLTHEPRLRLRAVATRDAERRRRAEADHGVVTFATLEGMLGCEEVELVILATPHHVHAEQAVAVLDAGRHCVVDKVMCLTHAEADAMIRARDRSGRVLSVFHNRRWDGDFQTIRGIVDADTLGQLRLVEMGIWRYSPPRGWRARREEAGSIMHDWGAHFLDQALLLIDGPAARVSGHAQYDWPDSDVESYLCAEIAFQSGVLLRMELSNRARLGKPRFFLLGDTGALTKEGVDPQEAAMLAGDIRAAREDASVAARVVTPLGGSVADCRIQTQPGDWTAYYRNIADVLMGRAPLAVTAEEARRGVVLLSALAQSVAGGRAVMNPEEEI